MRTRKTSLSIGKNCIAKKTLTNRVDEVIIETIHLQQVPRCILYHDGFRTAVSTRHSKSSYAIRYLMLLRKILNQN